MEDPILSSLKQAFEHANDCYIDLDGVTEQLENALEALPAEDTEIRALTTQMLDKTFEIQDSWSGFLAGLRDLRLKYRAAYIPTENSPEVDGLLEVLAKIEARRRKQGRIQE